MMRKQITSVIAVVGLISCVILSSCSSMSVWSSNSNSSNHTSASYRYFDGSKTRDISVNAGQTITINYTTVVQDGKLSVQLLDPDNVTIAEMPVGLSKTVEIQTIKSGTYKLVITAVKSKGSYDLNWSIK